MSNVMNSLARLSAVQAGTLDSAAAIIDVYKEVFTGPDIPTHAHRLAALQSNGFPFVFREELDERGNVIVPKDREPYWNIYLVIPGRGEVLLCARASEKLRQAVVALCGAQGGL